MITRARDLQEQTLAARRRLLGDEHPDTLCSMNNLALTLCALGDHAGARECANSRRPTRSVERSGSNGAERFCGISDGCDSVHVGPEK